MILAARIEDEIARGFPLLGPVPQTGVVQLIDYITGLNRAERNDLVEALATRAEAQLRPTGGMLPWPEPWDRFYTISRRAGPFSGGLRYTDIRFISQVPKLPQFGGIEAWNRGFTGLATTPRTDLLPDPAAFLPAKATLLKSLVTSVLTPLGYVAQRAAGGGLRYLSAEGVLVDVDVGSRIAQLRYGVAIRAADKASSPLTGVTFTSVESLLFSTNAAWDYVTEENASRSISHLPTLIREATRLLEMV
jgi:hypothetical protein